MRGLLEKSGGIRYLYYTVTIRNQGIENGTVEIPDISKSLQFLKIHRNAGFF